MKKITLALVAVTLLIACTDDVKKTTDKSTYLLNKISEKDSGIDFANLVSEDAQHSIINYIYYYNGGGLAAVILIMIIYLTCILYLILVLINYILIKVI